MKSINLSESNILAIRDAAIKKTLDNKCNNKAEYLNLGLACELIVKGKNKKYDILIGRDTVEDDFDYRFDRVL